ncbi:MAG: hypothetical protein ACRETD_10155 [Steroidobacteraceae bacterium]
MGPNERTSIDAAAPIYDRDHRDVIGNLQVTESTERRRDLRDRALTEMLNFTLITTVLAIIATFVFAAHLAVRLARQ